MTPPQNDKNPKNRRNTTIITTATIPNATRASGEKLGLSGLAIAIHLQFNPHPTTPHIMSPPGVLGTCRR